MIGNNRLGASAYTATPAIVQEAKKDWRYYEAKITASEECTGRLYREYKDGGTWKEKYKTWADACEPLGKSRSQVDRIISNDHNISALCANVDNKKEEESLKQVEAARQKPEPKEEEPDKPAVHSADEKQQSNGHVKPTVAKALLDVSGCVIPQGMLAMVERRQEVVDAMRCASQLKCLFETVQNGHDALFSYLKHTGSNQTFMNGAATMHAQLRECCPDVVCPECGGRSVSCHYCFGSGWISEVRWNRDWLKSNDIVKQVEVKARAAFKAKNGTA